MLPLSTQNALRIKTKVSSQGKIEIYAPELAFGEVVEIIILFPSRQTQRPKSSALNILMNAKGQRLFKSAQEVDAYLSQERGAWDN